VNGGFRRFHVIRDGNREVLRMYKIIACDLDETLLNSERSVSQENREAIRKARELGVKFVPATGRGYASVRRTLEELGVYGAEDEYVISFNGGVITENKGNRLMHFEGLPFGLAERLYKKGLEYGLCIHVYTKEKVYACNLTQDEKDYVAGRMELAECFEKDLGFLSGEDIVKILYVNTDFDYLKQIEEELKPLTKDCEVSFSSNRYIEFNLKGVNKGRGLLRLAEMLGVSREETIAIGDNFNDLSMIQTAGLGVGVRNTAVDMKPLCDVITEATNEEHAVAEVIERYILNP